MTDDDQLMIRLQAGDAQAFDELVHQHQSALVGFFFNNTRDLQLSEDLTQETLLRVYNQSWNYLPSGRFRGWMFRIGRNLLIDNVRKQTNDVLVRAIKGTSEGNDDRMARIAVELLTPNQLVDRQEVSQLLDRLLQKIPEDQRSTVVLHYYNGLTLAEVADAMGCTVSTAKSRLRLARKKLTDYLQQHGLQETDF